MDGDADVDKVVGPVLVLMRLLGLWPQAGRDRTGCLTGAVRRTLAFVPMALMVVGSALKLCLDTPEQFEDITLCAFITNVVAAILLKAVMLVVQGGRLRQLSRLLAEAWAEFPEAAPGGSTGTRGRYEALADRMRLCFQVGGLAPLLCWLSAPLVPRLTAAPGQRRRRQRQLPIPAWMPTDVYASPAYELVYALQALGCAGACAATICADSFFVRLLLLIAAELKVLNENISSIRSTDPVRGDRGYTCRCRETAVILPSACEDCRNTSIPPSEKTADELHRQLVNIIRHHQIIIRMVSLLQEAMDVSIFVLLFANMANLCSSLFTAAILLQEGGSMSKILKGLSPLPVVLYQTSLFCIFGHIVTDQSEELVNAAAGCQWAGCDVRFKRSLLIFMTAALRPLDITVGKVCPLSREMLLQVLNGTYALMNMFYYYHHKTK
uniref:Odorant receptor n=1 Tax=Ceracris kiangsu TaxID=227354 RepID=A0A6M6DQD0_CERKI|nr:odorant receptor 87 [Ceracris kiangsu]